MWVIPTRVNLNRTLRLCVTTLTGSEMSPRRASSIYAREDPGRVISPHKTISVDGDDEVADNRDDREEDHQIDQHHQIGQARGEPPGQHRDRFVVCVGSDQTPAHRKAPQD